MDVLDPEFLRRLERLTVVARKTLRGVGQGERRSKRHGGTVEFADYRGYTPGDDTRQIDWYAYARLEELYLKLYVQEQDLALHLLIDQSASMGTGTPPKLSYARTTAAALASSSATAVARSSPSGSVIARMLAFVRDAGRFRGAGCSCCEREHSLIHRNTATAHHCAATAPPLRQ